MLDDKKYLISVQAQRATQLRTSYAHTVATILLVTKLDHRTS
jgi:hypothetical protein